MTNIIRLKPRLRVVADNQFRTKRAEVKRETYAVERLRNEALEQHINGG